MTVLVEGTMRPTLFLLLARAWSLVGLIRSGWSEFIEDGTSPGFSSLIASRGWENTVTKEGG